FLDGGETLADLEHGILVQGLHAGAHGDAVELGDLDILVDGGGELLAVCHEFVDTDAALVAGASAGGAALGVGLENLAAPAEGLFEDVLFAAGGFAGDLAVFADAAQEALGADGDEGGGDVEGLNAHLSEAGDGRGGVVGVEGRDEQVAGEGGLDGDAGGLLVADLADEDDVGVHTQVAAQGAGEGEADLPVHLHLVDAGERVFDGILGGLDVDVGVVDLGEGRVESHGLAGAGGAAVQDHAVGLANAGAVAFEIFVGETEGGQRQGGLLLVENAHDDLLAEVHGAGGDAQINVDVLLGVFFEDDASVLRQPAFGDVEVAHDLQAGDEGVADLFGQAELFLTEAVDAVADEKVFFLGFDVDVGGAADVGVLDDAVDQLDDGRGVLVFEILGLHLGTVAAVGGADDLGDIGDIHIALDGGLGIG